jgi:hypothetical protein
MRFSLTPTASGIIDSVAVRNSKSARRFSAVNISDENILNDDILSTVCIIG